MRILIADDQRSFGLALADMVRCCDHQVVAVVGSGLEAIQAYGRHKPDLVLMDFRMPKLNGATACRHILAKNPSARIILVSAWSPLDGADQSGAMSFLPKPVDFDRLAATLLAVSQILPSPVTDLPSSNSDLPTPISDLPAPGSSLFAPCSDLPASTFDAAPLEMIFPVNAPVLDLFPQTEEAFASAVVDLSAVAVAPEKNSRNTRGNHRRRTQRARAR